MKRYIPDLIKMQIKKKIKKTLPVHVHSDGISYCICCGSFSIVLEPILWSQLIAEWGLSDHEVKYINRQQGIRCKRCKANLRTMALAYGIMRYENYHGLFMDLMHKPFFKQKKILEMNEAGKLTQYLDGLHGHILAQYPEVDIQNLHFENSCFDLVIHSDVLEHVSDPVKALQECYRVLKDDGYCIFTIPIVIDRLTRSRDGLPASHHGSEMETGDDYLVHTEFGSDAWKFAIEAGFSEVRIYSLEYPAAQCLLCRK